MKAVILAGGYGSRISEETDKVPKPMVEIGGKPILWHIMKIYSSYGINDFIICLGYKGYVIKEYFSNYFLHTSDVTIDLRTNSMEIHHKYSESWKVTLIDTGLNTMTGGRLKKIKNYLNKNEPFFVTYGDGLSDVNIKDSLDFHNKHGKLVTVTAVCAPGRFGVLTTNQEGTTVEKIIEKPQDSENLINGGFFVLNPEALDYIESDEHMWEKEPLESLSKDKQLAAYVHYGFWQPMDTLREKRNLEDLWVNDKAPWKKW
jgi:glucose-1-phosphate cytidylyltransferase